MQWKRPRLRFVVVLGVLLVLSLFLAVNVWTRDSVVRAYDQVRLGMTEEEVDKRVRIPHGSYRNDKGLCCDKIIAEEGPPLLERGNDLKWDNPDGSPTLVDMPSGRRIGKEKWWESKNYFLIVIVDPDGRVIRRVLYKRYDAEKGMVDRANKWIRKFLL